MSSDTTSLLLILAGVVAFFVIFIVLIIVSIVYFVRHYKKQEAISQQWFNELASKHGLTIGNKSPIQYSNPLLSFASALEFTLTVHGIYRNTPIVVQDLVGGPHSEHGPSCLRFTAKLNTTHFPPGLVIYTKNVLAKAGLVVGANRIQIDDPQLDNLFVFHSPSYEHAYLFLTHPDVRHGLLQLAHAQVEFRIQDNLLRFDRLRNMFKDTNDIQIYIDHLVDCAKAFEKGTVNSPQPRAVTNVVPTTPPDVQPCDQHHP